MIVLSVAQQRKVGDAARRVGGYDELIRIASKHRRIIEAGGKPVVKRLADGRYDVEASKDDAPLPTQTENRPTGILRRIWRNLRRPHAH